MATIKPNTVKAIVACAQNEQVTSDRRLTARSLAMKHQSAAREGNSRSRSWKFCSISSRYRRRYPRG